jgi:hypothetical protein
MDHVSILLALTPIAGHFRVQPMARWFLLMLLLPVWSWSRDIDSSAGGVTIYRELTMSGRARGDAYWAENDNDSPIWLTIELVEEQNAYDGLVKGRLYIFPHQTVYLGTVSQRAPNRYYLWRYRWDLEPAGPPPAAPQPTPRQLREAARPNLQPAPQPAAPQTPYPPPATSQGRHLLGTSPENENANAPAPPERTTTPSVQ